jgi:hypothetical protein
MTKRYHFVIFKLLAIVLSVHRFTSTDYPFGIFTPLLQLMCKSTNKINSYQFSNGCRVISIELIIILILFFFFIIEACSWRSDSTRCYPGVCANEIVESCSCTSGLVSSNFWSLYCLSIDLHLLITPLVSSHLSYS